MFPLRPAIFWATLWDMDRRFDSIRLDSYENTAEGYIRSDSPLTRVGVFSYKMKDGSVRRELRHPEDVFDPGSLATLKAQVVTDSHPDQMLTAENARKHQVGFTGENIRADGKFVRGPVHITDGITIKKIRAGKRELSCGYTAKIEKTSGTYDGEDYDVRQRNIVYNHLSVVTLGRAGRDVALRLDDTDAILEEDFHTDEDDRGSDPANPKGGSMEKIKIAGKEYEVTKDVADAIRADAAATQARVDSQKAELDTATKRATDAEAKVAPLQAKVDSLEADAKNRTDAGDEAKFAERVQKRVKLERVAGRVDKDIKLDGVSDIEVMKAAITKAQPTVKLDGKADAYIEAMFDIVAEKLDTNERAANGTGRHILDSRKDGGDATDPKAARQKRMDEDKDAWKQPLSAVKA